MANPRLSWTRQRVQLVDSSDNNITDTNPVPTQAIGFTNYKQLIGVFNETLVSSPSDEISVIFDYGVLQNKPHGTKITTTGDGSVTDVDGLGVISSTTGTAIMTTRDRITYKPGHTVMARFTVSFNGDGAGQAGLFDSDNGFFIKRSNGVLSVVRRKNGTDTEETTLNGDDISSIDWTKIQICYIIFGFLGVGNPSFYVLRTDGTPLKIHTFETIGTLTSTHVRHPVLPFRFETDGDMELRTGSLQGFNFTDGDFIGKQNFCGDHSVSIGSTTTATIVSYRSKETFEYKSGTTTANKKKARLLQCQFFVDPPASGQGTLKFTINQTSAVAGGTWTDVSQYDSVMEYNTTGTPTIVKKVIAKHLYYAGNISSTADFGGDISFDADRLGLVAYDGDIFTIQVQNYGTTTVTARVTLNWEEI